MNPQGFTLGDIVIQKNTKDYPRSHDEVRKLTDLFLMFSDHLQMQSETSFSYFFIKLSNTRPSGSNLLIKSSLLDGQ